MLKKVGGIISLCLLLSSGLRSEQLELILTRGKGGKSASFLEVGFEPYGIATGGMIVSGAGNIRSIFWNPADLSDMETSQLLLGSSILPGERFFNYISFATITESGKAWGLTALNTFSGEIELFDENDTSIGKTRYIGNSFIFSYATGLQEIIKFGFNIKGIGETFKDNNGFGGGVDIGLIISPPFVSLGAIAHNVVAGVWQSGDEKLIFSDASYIISVAAAPSGVKIGVSFLKEAGKKVKVNIGMEIEVVKNVSIMGGFYKGEFATGIYVDTPHFGIIYSFYNDASFELYSGAHLLSINFNF